MTQKQQTSRQARQQLRAKLSLSLSQKPKAKIKKLKVKSSKVRKNKEWCSISGLEFPIYMHDYKGRLITKIVDHTDMIERVGVSNYVANVIKEKRFFRGAFFSYNKHIDITQFSKPKIRLVA